MRTLVDIPDKQIADLAALCAAKKVSRAEVIRRAIVVYIEDNKPTMGGAFGVWQQQGQQLVDGLTYQERARAEW